MSSPNEQNPTGRNRLPVASLAITAVVLVAIVVGAVALWRSDRSGDSGSGLPAQFDYDLNAYKTIDPALFIARQTSQIPLSIQEPRSLATGPDDRIYVVGDRAIAIFNSDGTPRANIALNTPGHCLAVAARSDSPERLFVGMREHIELLAADGTLESAWPTLGDKALITSIALAEPAGQSDIFVADAGNRVVLRLDRTGKLLGRIGRRDQRRHIPGLIIPSPYCDVAVSPDGLLRVANTGAHHIEAYTFDGDYEQPLTWGKASLKIAGFCGCCNPANFALLPDGRFITAEKGIPRVKIYTADGQFQGVVAGPETLAPTATITEETREEHRLSVVDVAADSHGRVLVLDPAARQVRIFELDSKSSEKSP